MLKPWLSTIHSIHVLQTGQQQLTLIQGTTTQSSYLRVGIVLHSCTQLAFDASLVIGGALHVSKVLSLNHIQDGA